ncbi:MAG: class I SAM-dependent methyltransferase [Okeania sp. SIO2G4]|uniref:class I SAM-dependent methyltransferase n=1 Tax=unclassified Okeania TaxID=2634635 RepID=UPI0013B6626B|nr:MULTISPECIES: class I SAM-dependent methyltransferase [unclassified Okeania]NEP44988.1 class I SAM-dependent methyltransferase [Okeania sp. SIO2H7]NEP74575.1 class I SAM-dependent methyltransferase [Okeania sp. SIO2G5]NEP95636.1 class I SAM-dependent methyltransferase [Okeania sp. SIO2F5]NEQ94298.1 class I SAM-dependent methyltransferase [Okeania sp. SIO2G4]
MNPLNRFSDRAEDYAQYRPNYPKEAITLMISGFENPSELLAADIGAGTGIGSRMLAEQGINVIAIEPNLKMKNAAQSHPLIEFREATAEATNLPNESVDLVTCFQAFHWFNLEPTLQEFHRILKPSGKLALLWNNWNREDGFTKENSNLMKQISKHHPNTKKKRRFSIASIEKSSYFVNFQHSTFTHRQELDLPGLIGRIMSSSSVPNQGYEREQITANLKALYDRWVDKKGLVYLLYRTELYVAEPRLIITPNQF